LPFVAVEAHHQQRVFGLRQIEQERLVLPNGRESKRFKFDVAVTIAAYFAGKGSVPPDCGGCSMTRISVGKITHSLR